MDIVIDRTSPLPVYRQITNRIRELIIAGTLPAGFSLPPERRLARALGVNRSTVLNAYRELKADGLVDAHVGRGTVVLPQPRVRPRSDRTPALPWRQLFREGGARAQDPLVRDLLALTERDDVISLSVGLPAPELLPLRRFQEVLNELVKEVGAPLLTHCPSEGHTPLRETLSGWVAARGIRCSASEVLILSGSQQGLDLVARMMLEPGDAVIVEEPSYFGALQAFQASQARLIGVPMDEEGMCTEVLQAILERHRPKLIYTLPTFQNPSGAVMSKERRRHLLELAYRYQVPILEDDPYSELHYDVDPYPSLKALDSRDHVLYISTFSKVLFPGLRLGYAVAPREVIRQMVLAKQAMDLHSNTPGQWVLDRFIRQGYLSPHFKTLRETYARKRDAMAQALGQSKPGLISWRTPKGGFYFWCCLPDGIQRTTLLARAAELGVSFLPGWSCFPDAPAASHIRLNFSFETPARITEGIKRLLAATDQVCRQPQVRKGKATGTPPIV